MPRTRACINDEVKAEVARLLTKEREKRGLSMNILAGEAGLSQSLISSFEKTKWNPTLETLLRISGALGVNLGEIIKAAIHNVEAGHRISK